MSDEARGFGCCGHFHFCSVLGYCTSMQTFPKAFKECSLFKNLFINKNQSFVENWKSNGIEQLKVWSVSNSEGFGKYCKAVLEYGLTGNKGLEVFSQLEYEKCLALSEKHKPDYVRYQPTKNTQETKSIAATATYLRRVSTNVRGLYLTVDSEGGLQMSNYKLVECKGDYELVSYVHKDLTHYAIRTKGTAEIYETFAPSRELKGWDLRKAVVEKLQKYALGEVKPSFSKLPSVTLESESVEIGQVITYENPSAVGDQKFWRVYEKNEYLLLSVDPNGIGMFWNHDSVNKRLSQGHFKVLKDSDVPEGIVFPARPKQ